VLKRYSWYLKLRLRHTERHPTAWPDGRQWYWINGRTSIYFFIVSMWNILSAILYRMSGHSDNVGRQCGLTDVQSNERKNVLQLLIYYYYLLAILCGLSGYTVCCQNVSRQLMVDIVGRQRWLVCQGLYAKIYHFSGLGWVTGHLCLCLNKKSFNQDIDRSG